VSTVVSDYHCDLYLQFCYQRFLAIMTFTRIRYYSLLLRFLTLDAMPDYIP
jgi:hypothetical protein